MIRRGTAFRYSLPRKMDAWVEQLGLRVPVETTGGAWGGGCSTAQAGGGLVCNLVTQRLCSSLPGCQTWDLWVISYVFPQLLPFGIAPEPSASSRQHAVLLFLACASQGAVTTDGPVTMDAAGGLPMGWGRDAPKASLWGQQLQL